MIQPWSYTSLTRHERIDGVRVVWDDLPGPYQGAFVVGCGARDEDVDQIGLTSLIVDLALDAVDGGEDDSGAGSMASFIAASGSPDGVAAYFADCCAVLCDLPLDDMAGQDDPIDQLLNQSAWAAGGRDPWASLLGRRFGRSGPGLMRWPAVASSEFTADEVRAYAARYFTADNTVLALSGAPPGGLRLALPPGPPAPRASPPSRLGASWYTDEVDGVGVAMSGTVGAPAVPLLLVLAERVAEAVLREDLEYRMTPWWRPVDRERVEFGLTLQLQDDYSHSSHAAAAVLLWQEVQRLVSEPPDREELEDAVAEAAPEPLDSTDEDILLNQVSDRLYQTGQRELFGVTDDATDLAALAAEVSPSDVRSAAASSLSTTTMVVPVYTDVELSGMTRSRCPLNHFVPNGVVLEPLSRSFRRRLRKAGAAERLVLGDDAVYLVGADGSVHTFPMADSMVIDDGELFMIGNIAHGCLVNISAFGGRSMFAGRLPARRYRGRRP